MEVVFEKVIFLQKSESQEQIKYGLEYVYSAQKMLFDILIPLAEIEDGVFDLFNELQEKGLIGENAPNADRRIDLLEDKLTIAISHGPDINEDVTALYN